MRPSSSLFLPFASVSAHFCASARQSKVLRLQNLCHLQEATDALAASHQKEGLIFHRALSAENNVFFSSLSLRFWSLAGQNELESFFFRPDVKVVFFLKDDDKEMFSIIDKMVEDDIFFDNGIKDVGITYVDTDSERCVKVFKLSQFSEPNQLIYKFPYNQTEFIEFLRVSSLKIVNNLSDRTYLRIFASPFKFQVHLFLKSDFFNRKNQEYMKAFQEAAMYNYEQRKFQPAPPPRSDSAG